MIKYTDYKLHSPERTFAEFVNGWINQNPNIMYNKSQISWRLGLDKLQKKIKPKGLEMISLQLLQFDLKDVVIHEFQHISEVWCQGILSANVTAYGVTRKVFIFAQLMKENKTGKCDVTGTWGINPISCLHIKDNNDE